MASDKLRIADIINDSIVDGPGFRMTVFTQGCPHNCEGCHNPQTHDFNGGRDIEISEIVDKFKKNPLLSGITLSGGEPFCQPAECALLAKEIKALGKNVISYSGYTFEKLLEKARTDSGTKALLESIDILIDGPFILSKKSLALKFRGSSNQRVIDVVKSLEKGEAVIIPD